MRGRWVRSPRRGAWWGLASGSGGGGSGPERFPFRVSGEGVGRAKPWGSCEWIYLPPFPSPRRSPRRRFCSALRFQPGILLLLLSPPPPLPSPSPRFFLSLALSSFPDPLFPVFLPLSLSVSTPRPLLVPRRRARRSWNFVVKMIEREDGFREGGWGGEPAARVGRTCERGRTTTGDDSSRGDWLLRCAFRSMNGMERVGGM